ncbi:hypothetical protein KKD52_08600 [Myxococcota bacterium]|nr:hypothetical protein [Myxococcota bacterium]MBU1410742.1 hypothetical protein [Myxococcota bacterium]MBU1510406.1 hypothetical protein [Myxococcota bacterium]
MWQQERKRLIGASGEKSGGIGTAFQYAGLFVGTLLLSVLQKYPILSFYKLF